MAHLTADIGRFVAHLDPRFHPPERARAIAKTALPIAKL